MARNKRIRPPISIRLDQLEAKHTSGLDPETGQRWLVRGAPVGALVEAQPGRKGIARRLHTLEPAPDAVEPPCPVFGTCGGCQLQEMPLSRQRQEKTDLVARLVGVQDDASVRVHPVVGAPSAYGYRNKLELSWGARRFVPEEELDAFRAQDLTFDGSFLGFHPPGWFGAIVPVNACVLGTPAMNRVLGAVAGLDLGPAWDAKEHKGAWRHLVLRDAGTLEAPQVLVTLVTSSEASLAEVERVAAIIAELAGIRGVLWVVTDRVAEVATGELRAVLHGSADLEVDLGPLSLQLPYDGFFQVNTEGARILFDLIGRALQQEGSTGGTLLDLYCGVGAIGLALADRFERIVGIELHAPAIETARQNAARASVRGEWHSGPVEDVLPGLALEGPLHVVVDPPRAGLHPRAARFLADLEAEVLVYVACGPASLERDRKLLSEGGWRMTDLWAVDLFPQTHHVEAVSRFVRSDRL